MRDIVGCQPIRADPVGQHQNGGNDVGLAWQLLASLQRVAVGYLLAVAAGSDSPDTLRVPNMPTCRWPGMEQ